MGIVQGSGVDADLNDFGRKQAQAFFDSYGDIPFDKVYTSVLKRTYQSIRGFVDQGIPHESHEGLNEISWGDKEGKQINSEEDAYYHFILEQWRRGNTTLPVEGGESPVDVTNRLIPVMDLILERADEEVILICMHGRAMRILLCYLLERPLSDMDHFQHANLGLYLLDYDGQRMVMEKENDIDHLRALS